MNLAPRTKLSRPIHLGSLPPDISCLAKCVSVKARIIESPSEVILFDNHGNDPDKIAQMMVNTILPHIVAKTR